jgi:hypothetical protein
VCAWSLRKGIIPVFFQRGFNTEIGGTMMTSLFITPWWMELSMEFVIARKPISTILIEGDHQA